MVTKAACCL